MPVEATGHAGVLDSRTDLIWYPRSIITAELPWEKAMEAANSFVLCGALARSPSVEEGFLLADRSKYPAYDERFFDFGPNWFWTSTRAAWARESVAWLVLFLNGGADCYHQSYTAFVLACRSARASQ